MFQSHESDANFQPEPQPRRPFNLPPHSQEVVRVILLGDYGGITNTIHQLAATGFADPQHWTELVPTGRTGEYISIHTRRSAPNA